MSLSYSDLLRVWQFLRRLLSLLWSRLLDLTSESWGISRFFSPLSHIHIHPSVVLWSSGWDCASVSTLFSVPASLVCLILNMITPLLHLLWFILSYIAVCNINHAEGYWYVISDDLVSYSLWLCPSLLSMLILGVCEILSLRSVQPVTRRPAAHQ